MRARLHATGRLAGTCALAGVWLLATVAGGQPQPSGRDIYLSNCAECHQADGAGQPGDVPALIHDRVANGPPDAAAQVVLGGDGPMPNFDAQLTDAQIAAVLSYVRTSFGNSAGPVSPSVVAAARSAMAHGQ